MARQIPLRFGKDAYTRGEFLGNGSFAEVYKCRRGSQEFAVKVMHIEDLRVSHDDKAVATLLREIDTLQQLQSHTPHESVVQFVESFEEEGFKFIVLEYVAGGTLKKSNVNDHIVEEECVRNISSQLVDGLCYLHGAKIIHRDLKLDNVLVVKKENVKDSCEWMYADKVPRGMIAPLGPMFWSGDITFQKAISQLEDVLKKGCRPILVKSPANLARYTEFKTTQEAINHIKDVAEMKNQYTVKIADFGCSKDEAIPTMSVVGAERIRAPEIAARQPQTCKADIWSLGVMTFELLAKKPPNVTERDPDDKTEEARKTAVSKLYSGVMTLTATQQEDLNNEISELRVSEDARSFLRATLQVDPSARWDADDLKGHEWFAAPDGEPDREPKGMTPQWPLIALCAALIFSTSYVYGMMTLRLLFVLFPWVYEHMLPQPVPPRGHVAKRARQAWSRRSSIRRESAAGPVNLSHPRYAVTLIVFSCILVVACVLFVIFLSLICYILHTRRYV